MLTRQIVLTTALLSAAFVLTACSAGVSEPAATPTPTETSCIICQSSDKNAQAAPENGADAPDEAAPPADENSDAGTGYQQPAPPPPAPSRPDSTPTVPVCPVAIAG